MELLSIDAREGKQYQLQIATRLVDTLVKCDMSRLVVKANIVVAACYT